MKKLLLSLVTLLGIGAVAIAGEVTFDFSKPESMGVTGVANNATVVSDFSIDNVKVVVTQGSGAQSGQELRFWNNADFRTSANGGKLGHQFNVQTVDGSNITKIEFTASNLNVTANPEGLSEKVWTGSASAVNFTTTGQVTITKMVVTYADGGSTTDPDPTDPTDPDPTDPTEPGSTVIVAFVADGATYSGDGETSDITNASGETNLFGASPKNGDTAEFTNNDITLVFTKSNSSHSQVNSKLVRWYQGESFTLTPSNGAIITKVSLLGCAGYTNTGVTVSADGAQATNLATGSETRTWEGSAAEVVKFTNSAQTRFSAIEVTYTTSATATVEAPVITVTPGATSYSVEITCATDEAKIYYTLDGEDPTESDTEYTQAIELTKTTTVKAIAVKGADQSRVVTKVVVVPAFANSIAELKELDNNTVALIAFEMTVGFKNYSNTFVTDGEDWIQIYNANDYEAGDVIPAGWTATYTVYQTYTPELTNCEGFKPSEETSEINFRELTENIVTVEDVNEVLIFKGVEFSEATPATKDNFTGELGGEELSLRNNYTIDSVEAGKYDVKVVVSIYNGEPNFYVIEYTEVDDTQTGIENVSAGNNSAVEYYNLQGVKVLNPSAGIYIRRQGSEATKVYVK